MGALKNNLFEYGESNRDPESPLRILLDARKLYDGGIGVYTQNLINGLLETREVEISILTKPGEVMPEAWSQRLEVIEDPAKSYSLDEMWNLGKRIDFSRYDLFHIPHYTLPFNIAIPAVITVHDLIHINRPEKSYYPWLAAPLLRSSLKRASRILTVSNATYKDIEFFLKGKKEILKKVRVVANALDPYYTQKKMKRNGNGHAIKPRVSGPYIMSIYSNLKPHKGLSDLLQAFQEVREKLGDIKLVLAGHGTVGMVGEEELLEQASKTKGVIILGSLNKDELYELYKRAQALIVASYIEGFCLPVIEAQSLSTPVVARPIPAVIELISTQDIICEDFSIKALAQGILRVLQRPKETDGKLDTEMQQHLRRFDCTNVARAVLGVYKEILEAADRRSK